MKNLKILVLVFSFTLFALHFTLFSYAQEGNKLAALTKQAIEAKSNEELCIAFQGLSDLYLSENKYNEFIDFLKSLAEQKKSLGPAVDYYIALTRYNELKYLEEKQIWEEYFSQGNSYREQLTASLQKAIVELAPGDPLSIYAKLLSWKFQKDQEGSSSEDTLNTLMESAINYSKTTESFEPLKSVADELLLGQERARAKEIYKLYLNRLVSSKISNEKLEEIAFNFYKAGNLDLAETVYDTYIAQIQNQEKDKLILALTNIAKNFSYKDGGISDPAYAERIFQKIEDLAARDIFSEELIYLRAFNAEKAKEYSLCRDLYNELSRRFPDSKYGAEADYKAGIISAYVLADLKSAKPSFEKLSKKENPGQEVIASLYQLGLLAQWENNLEAAKNYYNELIAKAKGLFKENVALAQIRLKEIEEKKPLEYNLKSFLDLALNTPVSAGAIEKVGLKSAPYNSTRGVEIKISSLSTMSPTGCMPVEVQYLWSGDTGSTSPGSQHASFTTQYSEPGIKVINLALISSTGAIARDIDFLNIN